MAGSLSPNGVSLTPSSVKTLLPTNYLDNLAYASQYLPEVYEKEFERYGNRSINSFLRNVSAEIPFASDLIQWSEQGRLHTKYTGVNADDAITTDTAEFTLASSKCNFRVGQVVFLSSESTSASGKAIITAVNTSNPGTFTAAFYTAAGSPFAQGEKVTAFVYGSEFGKGTEGMDGSLTPEPQFFNVKPVIIKDRFTISGSDMAQIGWVEVTSENGATGYLWYIKAEHETRLRFEDALEMMSVEHIQAETNSGAETYFNVAAPSGGIAGMPAGSQGMFAAIEARGNVWSGGNPAAMSDFDTVVERLDAQGAIAENTLFVNRQFSLDIDDMLATQNSYGVGGTSYGMFDNDANMALNLGFTGFRRGSYDFYKSDWKYLNAYDLRGGINGGAVNGALIPAGTTTVYDQVLGKNATRPFLHVRYRASENENRKLKTWITGSAGGAATSSLDAMEVHYLSERALCTLGANNFFLFKN